MKSVKESNSRESQEAKDRLVGRMIDQVNSEQRLTLARMIWPLSG